MKLIYVILFVFLVQVFGASIDPECTSASASFDQNYDNGTPQNVLYVVISWQKLSEIKWGSHQYMYDMYYTGYDMVKNGVSYSAGSNIDRFLLHQTAPLDLDLTVYDQIWVADLSSSTDNSPTQMAAYSKIANWWTNKGKPHVICDGRWISSIWNYTATGAWGRPNVNLTTNYFMNLKIRGGGLVLLTDHAPSFTPGINEINAKINIKPFVNMFNEAPFQSEVDTENPLMAWPKWAPDTYRDGKWWLWDDSSTSDAPYNQQPNGLILYPLGWHASRAGQPGISSTIRGSRGFLISIVSPLCDDSFLAGQTINFTLRIDQTAGEGTPSIRWKSSLDGALPSTSLKFLANSLTEGTHLITATATDPSGLVAEAKVRIHIVYRSNTEMCYATMFNDNGLNVAEIFPILKNGVPAVTYLSYNTPNAGASNTGLETSGLGQFFFYDDGTSLSLFNIFGSVNDVIGGRVGANLTSNGLANIANIIFRDDPTSPNFKWTKATGSGNVLFDWKQTTTGFVMGDLPRGKEFCIRYRLDTATNRGIDSFAVKTQTRPNNDRIDQYKVKATLLNSIHLCYTKCRCIQDKPLTELTDSFDNHGVLFDANGNIGNYLDNSNCSWRLAPVSPTNQAIWAVNIYPKDYAMKAGDSLSVYDLSGNLMRTFSASPFPSVYTIEPGIPVILRFVSDASGNDRGFDLTYWVLPQLNSISPKQGPIEGNTLVTVTGANFINSPHLACKFDTEVRPATYIDSQTIQCVSPSHAYGTYNFEVTNDGLAFTNTVGNPYPAVNFTWTDATCDLFTDCGSCLGHSDNCQWCNVMDDLVRGSYCYSGNDETKSCDIEKNILDDECCSACIPLGNCSGNGMCNCNNTCNCDSDYRDDNCGCKKCPTDSNGTVCSGDEFGSCNCDGTCTCEFGHVGDACECLLCGGWPDSCSGNGQCNCNGTCTCKEGFTGPLCDCSTECLNDCSGRGNCTCGVCQCEEGYQLLPDCSCQDTCTDNCNDHGDCGCDGNCMCFEGFFGPTCNETAVCDYDTCGDCIADKACGWCTAFGVCENILFATKCSTTSSEYPLTQTECPVITTVTPAPEKKNHLVTGLVVGLGGAAVIGAAVGAIAFFSRKKETNEFLTTGTDPFSAASYNPMYTSGQMQGVNPLYEEQ